MPTSLDRPIAIYFEHPRWFGPLFAELSRRGVPHQAVEAPRNCFNPEAPPPDWGLFVNRMSPSAHLRGNGGAVTQTLHFLEYLERHGVPMVNGSDAFRVEVSKARQLQLMAELGLPTPLSRIVGAVAEVPLAAAQLRFPVVVKPNLGGSGAGIRRFDGAQELEAAVEAGRLELGPDGCGLVQELIPPRGGSIVRVEVLGGRFLYAIRVAADGRTFNLCPASLCRTGDAPPPAEAYRPPPAVIEAVERLTAAAGIEVGGVEYLVDDRDGRLCYFDVNALSNFVADAPRVVGFEPFERLVDHLLARRDGAPATLPRRAVA